IVAEEPVEESLAKVLVRVAERNGTRIRYSQEEAREVVSRRCSGEGERSARVLLRQRVELISPHVTAPGHAVTAALPEVVVRKCEVLRAMVRVLPVGQCASAAGKVERR